MFAVFVLFVFIVVSGWFLFQVVVDTCICLDCFVVLVVGQCVVFVLAIVWSLVCLVSIGCADSSLVCVV